MQIDQGNSENVIYFQKVGMLLNTAAKGNTSPMGTISSPGTLQTEDKDLHPWGNVTAFLPGANVGKHSAMFHAAQIQSCSVHGHLYVKGQGCKMPSGHLKDGGKGNLDQK